LNELQQAAGRWRRAGSTLAWLVVAVAPVVIALGVRRGVPTRVAPAAAVASAEAPPEASQSAPPAKEPSAPAAIWPRALPAHGLVGVIAPGRPVETDRLERGLAALRARGLTVKEGAHLRSNNGSYAGSTEQRAADFNAMLADANVAAIWCARGGAGCLELLPRLDWDKVGQRRLPLIGYSDVTLLQLAQFQRCRLIAYSGPMVAEPHGFGADHGIDDHTAADELQWLRLSPPPAAIQPPPRQTWLVVQPGEAHGPLLGGNLSRIVQLLGTPWLPDFKGAVLLLEETHETAGSVRSMLAKLADAGLFRNVNAVVLGDFTDCLPIDELHASVRRALAGRDIPVLSHAPYGHILPRSTWPLGASVRLTTSPPRVAVLDAAGTG
jgi:muramoyltetrapeptide carboxypeptidase